MERDPEQRIDPKASGSGAILHRLRVLGPGLITGAADDDPSGIGTYSQAGAAYGFALGWTMVLTYPLMCAVQIASARLGRSTGHGIAGNLARHYPNWLLQAIVALLLTANTINIGADLGAMADAVRLLTVGPQFAWVLAFGAVTIVLEVFVSYRRYVVFLKWLTLSLFAYVATLGFVHVDWLAALEGIVLPRPEWDAGYLTMIVAVFGTTISPYLFFWQASEEVAEIAANPRRHPLADHPDEAPRAIGRIRTDTLIGMGFSNAIALAIILTTAATLHAGGITDIQTSAKAAEALRPIAGDHAATVFALGIVGTGMLAVPILAGSAAYALGEARGWPVGLERKPRQARAFYGTIAVATIIGIGLNFTSIDPVKALVWAAVINGIVSAPVLIVTMLMTGRHDIMGRWTLGPAVRALGWLATAMMALTVVAMVATTL